MLNLSSPQTTTPVHYLLLTLLAVVLTACSGDAEKTYEFAAQGVYSAVISDDGSTAVVGSIQHGGSFWSIDSNERRFNWNHTQGEFSSIVDVDIDPSGDFAITTNEQTVILWDTRTGEPLQFRNSPSNIKALKLSRNGDYALLGLLNGTAQYVDIKNGGVLHTLRTNATVRAVDLDEAGTLALTGDDNYHVTLWDTATGNKLYEWTLSNRIASIALSADGQYAFGAAQLGTAQVWDTSTGKAVFDVDTGALSSRKVTISKAQFSADNNYLLTGGINSKVELINLSNGNTVKSWQANKKNSVRPTGSAIRAVGFGLDGKYYAIGSNGLLNEFR